MSFAAAACCAAVGIEVKPCLASYRGFTAALLLSTDRRDYLIDPFRIYPHLYRLNSITANPKILKIFFDAADQILYLQVTTNGLGFRD